MRFYFLENLTHNGNYQKHLGIALDSKSNFNILKKKLKTEMEF